MAFVFDVNYPLVLTGPQAMFRFKAHLKSVGWTVPSSGDGLSAFSSSSDIITSGNSGANGLANTNAWFRLQSPAGAGTREFTFQRGASNQTWTAKYSFSAGFTGGTPSATVPGTATDSQTLANAVSLFTSDNTYRIQILADNAAPYGFCLFAYVFNGQTASSPVIATQIMMDPLLTGSFPVADNDPVMFIVNGSNPFNVGSAAVPLGYLKKGLAGEGFVNIPWLRIGAGTASPFFAGGAGTNSWSGKESYMPLCYARDTGQTAPVGWKGVSSMMKLMGLTAPAPTAITISTSRDFVALRDCALIWNGSKLLV